MRNIINDNQYKVIGSVGKGNWAACPHVCILDTEITTSTRFGFYIAYLFKEDMSGLYLSFMWGSTQFEHLDSASNDINEAVFEVKNLIKENNNPSFSDFDFYEDMDLGSIKSLPKSYENASIIFKYYAAENIPDEEELVNDLKNFIDVYQFAIENYQGNYLSLIRGNELNKEGDGSDKGIGDEDVKTINYWLYSPGEHANKWNEFYNENVMAIGWEIGDLRKFRNKQLINNRLKGLYKDEANHFNDALCLWQFTHEIQVGDIIFAKRGVNEIVGMGIVESDYEYDKSRGEYTSFRKVDWKKKGNWRYGDKNSKLVMKTLTKITDYKELVKELNELVGEIEPEPPKYRIYTKKEFLEQVYVTETTYETLVNLLKNKKNLILQGAPGVGKTFMAKRLAYSIMGVKDVDRVMMVQFHQSYSYEDFVMGYRPSKDGFELREGSFYKFCKKAEDDDENDYFFIIDEINRGNLSKIFGELFMLIENDKRGEKNKIQLLYSDELFYIPKNVHIIGLMNTADRSLAMIDYALRRRFAFFDLKPGFSSDGFKSYQSNIDYSLFDNLIRVMEELNVTIKEDETLGEGFRIGHSYFCNLEGEDDLEEKLNYIVEYEIIPLLKEYWFDEPSKVEDWSEKLRKSLE